jgi:hypothetical protein
MSKRGLAEEHTIGRKAKKCRLWRVDLCLVTSHLIILSDFLSDRIRIIRALYVASTSKKLIHW